MNFVCNFEKCRLQLENDSGFSAMKKPGGGCLPFWEAPRGRCGFPAAPGTERRAGGCCSLGGPESSWLCLSRGLTGIPPQSSRPVLAVQTVQCRLSPRGSSCKAARTWLFQTQISGALRPTAVYGPGPTCLNSSQTLRSLLPERGFPPLQSGVTSIYLVGLLGICETVGTHV